MADEYEEFLRGVQKQAPSEGPTAVPAGSGEDEYTNFLKGVPSTPKAAEPLQLSEAIQEKPSSEVSDRSYDYFLKTGGKELPGWSQLFSEGVARGWGQTKAMVPSLQAIAADLSGDKEHAATKAREAEEILKQYGDSAWELKNVKNVSDFSDWMVEKLGEQAVNVLTMMGTAGVGGAGVKLAASQLLARGAITLPTAQKMMTAGIAGVPARFAVPGFAGAAAMETAGTSQEQFGATGDVQSGLSLGAGAVKGALELWAPFSVFKAMKTPGTQLGRVMGFEPETAVGRFLLGTGKVAAKEGVTESLQEAVDITARKVTDPNYSFFGQGPDWWNGPGMQRLIEAGAAGAAVGGVYSAPFTYREARQGPSIDPKTGKPLQEKGTQEVIDPIQGWGTFRREIAAEIARGEAPDLVDPNSKMEIFRNWQVNGGDLAAARNEYKANPPVLTEEAAEDNRQVASFLELWKSQGEEKLPSLKDGPLQEAISSPRELNRRADERAALSELPPSLAQKYIELNPPISAREILARYKVGQSTEQDLIKDMEFSASLRAGPLQEIIADDKVDIKVSYPSKTGETWSVESKFGRMHVRLDKVNAVAHISRTALNDEEAKGQGHGLALYKAMVDKALDAGYQVISDDTVSEEASRMYEALKRRGYLVLGPRAELQKGEYSDLNFYEKKGSLFDGPRERGVYQVLAKPTAPPETTIRGETKGPVSRLRDYVDKLRAKVKQTKLLQEIIPEDPRADLWSISPLVSESMPESTAEFVADMLEAHTPRYLEIGPDGKLGQTLYTDTDLELRNAERSQTEKPRLLRVNQDSLQLGMMTAHVFDLPTEGSDRIWFLEGTSMEEQARLIQQYDMLQSAIAEGQPAEQLRDFKTRNEVESVTRPIYDKLLSKGLRVIPSRGSSFYYTGTVNGAEVQNVLTTGRSVEIAKYNPATNSISYFSTGSMGAQANAPATGNTQPVYDPTWGDPGTLIVSVDKNKLRDSDVIWAPDNKSFVLKQPFRPNVLVPGIRVQTTGYVETMFVSKQIVPGLNIHVMDVLPQNAEGAAKIVQILEGMKPGLESIMRELGLSPDLAILVTDGTTVNGPASAIAAYGTIEISPEGMKSVRQMGILSGHLEYDIPFVTFHELGHLVMYELFKNFPTPIKSQILQSWHQANLSERMDPMVISEGRMLEPGSTKADAAGTTDPRHREYYLTFSEYNAEQWRRWAHSAASPKSHMDANFDIVSRNMERFFQSWERYFGAKAIKEMREPSWQFSQAMEFTRQLTTTGVSVDQLIRQMTLNEYSDGVLPETPASKRIMTNVIAALQSMMEMVPPHVKVAFQERIAGRIIAGGRKPAGNWDPALSLITLAVGSLKPENAYKESRIWFAHELMHAYEDLGLITPKEIAILDRDIAALEKKGKGLAQWLKTDLKARVRQWAEGQNKAAGKEVYSQAWIEAKYEDMLAKEKRAYYIQEYADQGTFESLEARDIMTWIIGILERVRNWFNGDGFANREDVIRSFFKGEMVSRADRNAEAFKVNAQMTAALDQTQEQLLQETLIDAWKAFRLHLRSERRYYSKANSDFGVLWQGFKTWLKSYDRSMSDLLEPHIYDTGRYYEAIKRAQQNEAAAAALKKETDSIEEDLIRQTISGSQLGQEGIPNAKRNQITPQKVTEVSPGLWMAQESFPSHDPKGHLFFFFEGGPNTRGANPAVKNLGRLVGHARLDFRGSGNWEVSDLGSDVPTLMSQMGVHISKAMGLTLEELYRPPSSATTVGKLVYARAARGSIFEGVFAWYQKDPRKDEWYSPNHIEDQLNYWQYQYDMATLDGHYDAEAAIFWPIAKIKRERDKWKALWKKVPKEVWNDPRLEKMFGLPGANQRDEVQGSLIRGGLAADDSKMQAALGDGIARPDAFREQVQISNHLSQAENARATGRNFSDSAPSSMLTYDTFGRDVWERATGYKADPATNKVLKNQDHEKERIGKFTKIFWGLHQLVWRNEHIIGLRRYLQHAELMNQLSTRWLKVADETARIWEKVKGEDRREAIAQALTDLNEMDYLSPAERYNKTVRLPAGWAAFLAGGTPTPRGELDRLFQAALVKPQDYEIIRRVQNDFLAFLKDVEQIRIKLLQKRITNPALLSKSLAELTKEMNELRQKPYFPMMRFGQYTATVRDPNDRNRVVYSRAFERQWERDAFARKELTRQFPGMDIIIGRIPDSAVEFQQIPGPLLKVIKEELLDKTGKTPEQQALIDQQTLWIEEFEQQHAPDRTFSKRWMPAKGTKGFSTDAFRAYAHYFQHGARYISRLAFMDELRADIAMVGGMISSGQRGDTSKLQLIVKYMSDHYRYMMEGGQDNGRFRAFFSLWFLGFSPMAAFMNLTQIPMVLAPTLSSHFGATGWQKVFSRSADALKATAGKAHGNPGFLLARDEMILEGRIDVGQAPEIAAFAEGYNLSKLLAGTGAERAFRTASWAGMWMFGQVERFNRELTMKVAYDLAMENRSNPKFTRWIEIDRRYPIELADLQRRTKLADPRGIGLTHDEAIAFIFAKEMIDRTQFQYAKYTDPAYQRGQISKNFLIFMKYTQSYLYALRFNGATFQMLVLMAFFYGLNGLPGSEEFNEFLRLMMNKLFGKDFDLKAKTREFVHLATKDTIFSDVGPDLALHGISRFSFGPGLLPEHWAAPRFDASANGSMGRVVPGLAEYMHGINTKKDYGDVLAESAQKASGAGYGYMLSMLQFLMSDPFSQDWKKWEQMTPRAAKAILKGYRYASDGAETTRSGAKIVKFDVTDPADLLTIVAQAMGATPTKVSQTWDLIRASRETMQVYTAQRSMLYAQFDKALRDENPRAQEDVQKAIEDYNERVREVDPSMAISTRQLRTALRNRAISREMQEQFLSPTKREITITDRLRELYPIQGSQKVK